MILIVTGGRDYTMRPADWLRLDALHFPETLAPDARARRHRMAGAGGPCDEQLAEARAFDGPVTALYEGEADGADTCAKAWARSRDIPVRPHHADWKRHGLSAGPRRNATMLLGAIEEASLIGEPVTLAAFPGGEGTADMVHQAEARRMLYPNGVRVLDYREGPAQRWMADDVAAALGDFERLAANGEPAADAWEVAIMKRWLELGGVGMPLCSAHLWSRHGRVTLPTSGCMYIGRKDLRHGIAASPLGNPFTKTDGADARVLLERYREHLREACRLETRRRPYERPVLAALHRLKPWSLLVCWCHASKPCHGTVVADAAQQLHAATALKVAGRDLPAAHWSQYRGAFETSATPPPPMLGLTP